MDVVVVTYAPDIKLLRHMLASYETYYQDPGTLFLITDRGDEALLRQIPLPTNARLVYRDDYPEVAGVDSFKQQLYLKLKAHELVTTEHFLVLDSDFVLIAPLSDSDFFEDGKPVWYYRQWSAGPAARWRPGSESFLGLPIEFDYLDVPQWILSRTVCAQLATSYNLQEILTQEDLSEFLLYGAFASQQFPEAYKFRDVAKATSQPVGIAVNQVPPTYLNLNPASRYEDYKPYKYAQFWSHWGLAEAKMVEFFEDSQRDHFGAIRRAADRTPLVDAAPSPREETLQGTVQLLWDECANLQRICDERGQEIVGLKAAAEERLHAMETLGRQLAERDTALAVTKNAGPALWLVRALLALLKLLHIKH